MSRTLLLLLLLPQWATEERQRTEAWCEEAKAAAERDRRAAAKAARDTRQQANQPPLRKERAEVEALQVGVRAT